MRIKVDETILHSTFRCVLHLYDIIMYPAMLKTYIVTFSFADPKYLQKILRQQLLHILHHSVLYHNLHFRLNDAEQVLC